MSSVGEPVFFWSWKGRHREPVGGVVQAIIHGCSGEVLRVETATGVRHVPVTELARVLKVETAEGISLVLDRRPPRQLSMFSS